MFINIIIISIQFVCSESHCRRDLIIIVDMVVQVQVRQHWMNKICWLQNNLNTRIEINIKFVWVVAMSYWLAKLVSSILICSEPNKSLIMNSQKSTTNIIWNCSYFEFILIYFYFINYYLTAAFISSINYFNFVIRASRYCHQHVVHFVIMR